MVKEIIPAMTKGMTEVQESLHKGHMIEIEEGILHSEVDLEIAIIQVSHINDKPA